MSKRNLRWVQRNEDKPHRCPECHAVCTYDRRHPWRYGPRTRITCHNCRVQWRIGARASRSDSRKMRLFLKHI